MYAHVIKCMKRFGPKYEEGVGSISYELSETSWSQAQPMFSLGINVCLSCMIVD